MVLRIIKLVQSMLLLRSDLKVQNRFFDELLQEQPLSDLNPNAVRSIREYVTLVIAGVSVPLAMARGQQLSGAERKLQSVLGVYALLRDKFDDGDLNSQNMRESALKDHLFDYMMHHAPDADFFVKIHEKVIRAQEESKRQFDPSISNEDILRITSEKCGNAFLLCRALMSPLPSEEEVTFIQKYGEMAQVGDDILDWYDDFNKGIHTLAIRFTLDSLQTLYSDVLHTTILAIRNLSCTSEIKRTIQNRILIMGAIFQLGLDNMLNKKIDNRQSPKMNNVTRDDMIIDMDKPVYWWRCLKRSLYLMKVENRFLY